MPEGKGQLPDPPRFFSQTDRVLGTSLQIWRTAADGRCVSDVFEGKSVLITGGRGYFGYKLGNELNRQGAEVVLFHILLAP